MKISKLSLISLTATLLTSSLMAGAFDITYDFTGTVTEAATSTSGDVSGSDATWVGYTSDAGFSASSDTAYIRSSVSSDELDLGYYLTITLTPSVDGELLYLSSFSFSIGGSSTSTTLTEDPVVSASVKVGETGSDFSSISSLVFTESASDTATHTITGSTSTFTTYTVDLSDAAYQGLESIEIRIYVYDDVDVGNVYDRINDISISGSSAIPEASTTVLLSGLSVFLFAFALKRRR
jgi:hypothetical protein